MQSEARSCGPDDTAVADGLTAVVATVAANDDDDAVDVGVRADTKYRPPSRRNGSPSGCSIANRAFLRSSCTVST